VGAVEVPRGILFHDYTYNPKGVCTKANCVIPTNQTTPNIELDMKALVAEIPEQDRERNRIDLGDASKGHMTLHLLLDTLCKGALCIDAARPEGAAFAASCLTSFSSASGFC